MYKDELPKWALLNEVKVGDVLISDDGFTCIAADARCVVQADELGQLWIPCRVGKHALIGQLTEDGFLVGLYAASAERG